MSRELLVPELPESVADATILSWHKQPGEAITEGESLVDLETDKVVLEVPSPASGILSEIRVAEGETVKANELLALIEVGESAVSSKAETPISEEEPALSPAVRRLINEHRLDFHQITGSGKHGRILKSDVEAHLAASRQSAPPALADSHETLDIIDNDRPEQRVAMTRLRQRIAERLLQVQQSAAILTTFNEVNLQTVTELRARYRERFEQQHEVRLGFMSFFVRAAVEALKQFPVVNASVDGSDIIYHGYYDIGIAVASPRGLVVPILRNADQLSFAQIEKGIKAFGHKAKSGTLSFDELSGGTFSITNGGVFGSMLSTPILNPPQSAILGMHVIQQRPVAENGKVVIRPMMYLALSYDHRIIDGSEAVQFLVTIKQHLEDPARLLLQV
ncbi:2-oxoglutarate dehydrogenase complex dihydrolipoyllysine-residue succinyltransferase [Candidatus Endoriftia persephonae]|jgi:2-oxoglutarate dehydrogenase E2 component (dihydrolipoamide succinyltransferase)|uniref:Dihydrolipoyllysine-residue succinyltransferase component of 2-oxoglutarate dehydrogenase complex n=2 Tax=Gammaproteobacteria TaxID=1236 RepID=G2FFK2_9GAMM|nr:2-oxoglutarate dehydrogenase complex dihydrolipoyllysine-residue succinyltransferase [Candidatus Endoriftia persephone]EGW54418.1 dihydrolipoyllysine-residue succinyltransferase component of 2-oxoglutarate dehydrogenase complex [endosymbiont of Tevnia jerichonana (vent Tica)]USF87211.1 2-oxoglutarate dehydrogenase complex dihydrolipoyllysine-residue succinyltransferase [Candidatus Endoriftia persephone]